MKSILVSFLIIITASVSWAEGQVLAECVLTKLSSNEIREQVQTIVTNMKLEDGFKGILSLSSEFELIKSKDFKWPRSEASITQDNGIYSGYFKYSFYAGDKADDSSNSQIEIPDSYSQFEILCTIK